MQLHVAIEYFMQGLLYSVSTKKLQLRLRLPTDS